MSKPRSLQSLVVEVMFAYWGVAQLARACWKVIMNVKSHWEKKRRESEFESEFDGVTGVCACHACFLSLIYADSKICFVVDGEVLAMLTDKQ